MTTFSPPDATCRVRVFKAGVLSAVGHDLELDVTRFSVTVGSDHIEGAFDGTSMAVRGALVDGRLDAHGLKDKDRRDILDNVRKAVFRSHRADGIRFESDELERTDDGVEGSGTLFIPPHRHELDFTLEIDGGRARGVIRLHQPDWGISPFKAPLGVLKVQPGVEVHLDLPWSDDLLDEVSA